MSYGLSGLRRVAFVVTSLLAVFMTSEDAASKPFEFKVSKEVFIGGETGISSLLSLKDGSLLVLTANSPSYVRNFTLSRVDKSGSKKVAQIAVGSLSGFKGTPYISNVKIIEKEDSSIFIGASIFFEENGRLRGYEVQSLSVDLKGRILAKSLLFKVSDDARLGVGAIDRLSDGKIVLVVVASNQKAVNGGVQGFRDEVIAIHLTSSGDKISINKVSSKSDFNLHSYMPRGIGLLPERDGGYRVLWTREQKNLSGDVFDEEIIALLGPDGKVRARKRFSIGSGIDEIYGFSEQDGGFINIVRQGPNLVTYHLFKFLPNGVRQNLARIASPSRAHDSWTTFQRYNGSLFIRGAYDATRENCSINVLNIRDKKFLEDIPVGSDCYDANVFTLSDGKVGVVVQRKREKPGAHLIILTRR